METNKRRFKISGGNTGGELTIGTISEEFHDKYCDLDGGDLFDAIMREDDSPWEHDNIEHINSCYDEGFSVVEIDDDDEAIDEETVISGYCLYSRDRYFTDEQATKSYGMALMLFDSQRGDFGYWIVETNGEDFDPTKLAFSIIDIENGGLVENVWYDKTLLEPNQDNMSTRQRFGTATIGWINPKNDTKASFEENMDVYWAAYEDQ